MHPFPLVDLKSGGHVSTAPVCYRCILGCVVGAGTQGPFPEAPLLFWGSTEEPTMQPLLLGQDGAASGSGVVCFSVCGRDSRSPCVLSEQGLCLAGSCPEAGVSPSGSRTEHVDEGGATQGAPGPGRLNQVQQPRLPVFNSPFHLGSASAIFSLLVFTTCISDLVYLKIRNTPSDTGVWGAS